MRGWIVSPYSQIEYFLGDIITRSLDMPEYEGVAGRLPHGAPKRIRRVRNLLEVEGFFSHYADQITTILDEFEDHHEIRNILAHGFLTIRYDPQFNTSFEFRKWHRTEEDEDTELVHTCFQVHLEYQAAQLIALSSQSLALFHDIHEDLGLVGQ